MKPAVALCYWSGIRNWEGGRVGSRQEGYKIGALRHTLEEISSTVDEILASGGGRFAFWLTYLTRARWLRP